MKPNTRPDLTVANPVASRIRDEGRIRLFNAFGATHLGSAAVLNVTVAEPTAASYLTVYPTGLSRPDASNLNDEPGQTVPNLVFAQIGRTGTCRSTTTSAPRT